ncbi:hypothetical protein [Staphylococcus haemolyticus]|nr:hypothetical protein [Staphylococcus haemolyticus]
MLKMNIDEEEGGGLLEEGINEGVDELGREKLLMRYKELSE